MAGLAHRLSLAGLASALVAAAPAAAQTLAFNAAAPRAFAKTEAILGGSSKLAAILAQQGGAPVQAPIRPAAASSTASLTLKPAVAMLAPRFAVADDGRPNLFGSVALDIRSTPLDQRWRKVARRRVGGAAAAFAASLKSRDRLERVEAVNWYVNKRVRFVDDIRQFGRADVWMAANETLRRGRGDCEDYAIAKLQMLRAAGFQDSDLYLSIVRDLVRRSDHAVLVVRLNGRMLVLDNGTDEVLESGAVDDYRPVFTLAAAGSWTHGYRRSSEMGTLAAVETPEIAPAADAQRSRSASLLALSTGFSK